MTPESETKLDEPEPDPSAPIVVPPKPPRRDPRPNCKSCGGTGKIRRGYTSEDGTKKQLAHDCGCTSHREKETRDETDRRHASGPARGHKGIPGTARPVPKPQRIKPRKNTEICAACDKRKLSWNMTAVRSDSEGVWNVCAACLKANRESNASATEVDNG